AFVGWIMTVLVVLPLFHPQPYRSWRTFFQAIRQRRILLVETLLLVTFVASLPAFLGLLGGVTADTYYFLDVAHWFALPLFVAGLAFRPIVDGLRGVLKSPAGAAAALLVSISIVNYHLLPVFHPKPLITLVGDTLETADQWNKGQLLKGNGGLDFIKASLRNEGVVFGAAFSEILDQGPIGRIRDIVNRAKERHGTDLALYVPPDNRLFWQSVYYCRKKGLLATTLTGVPMVVGVPPSDLCPIVRLRGFGYHNHGPDAVSRPLDRNSLCAHARRRGFGHVLILDDLETARTHTVAVCR
ncbi:MAG: hypothetical protein HQL50_12165, partial [Magnetococcales bacterium]|nr:hypothetical protein [Magnetococcales bacterium]